MKKIRTKILLLSTGIVLLSLLPVVWLVNGLVLKSYRIGVNPRVEKALGNNVAFSRDLYQAYKVQLADLLSNYIDEAAVSAILTAPAAHAEVLALPADAGAWQLKGVQIFDVNGRQVWRSFRQGTDADSLLEINFARLEESSAGKIVLAERERNRFIALEKRVIGGNTFHFALQAALTADFLADSEQGLEVYQLYRTLAVSPEAVLASFRNAFLIFALAILLLTVGIAVWLSRRITRPLGALATGTEELGRGNLDYRIAAQGRDEIGELVRHFNRMAGQLQEFQEKTIYLERMAAWQEIARRLAHEIKNPLTPIQLTIQEMVDQYRGEDADYAQLLRECHGIIHEEIENLRRLVREFSDFGRLPELHIQPGDLHQLIREVRALYPKQEIELELAENLPPLPIDEDRIRRVLINLIENALQADPGHHPITIRTRRREGRVEVEVEDRGSGMSVEVAEKIFQPYFTTKKKGVGLGLAITRKMVEEHGGRIAVHSTPGEGSRFVFELAEG